MMKITVQCFLPYADEARIKATVASLRESALIEKITLLSTDASAKACLGCNIIYIDNINSSATMKKSPMPQKLTIPSYTQNTIISYRAISLLTVLLKLLRTHRQACFTPTITACRRANAQHRR